MKMKNHIIDYDLIDDDSDDDNDENCDDDDDIIMMMMMISMMTCGGGVLLCVSIQIYAAWPGNWRGGGTLWIPSLIFSLQIRDLVSKSNRGKGNWWRWWWSWTRGEGPFWIPSLSEGSTLGSRRKIKHMDREEAAFKWNLWSWTQTEILGGISTGELEATDKLDRSFFRIWEACRKEALNRSLVCSENFKQLVEWLAPSCEWTKANLIWPSKWRSMTIRYSKTDLWKIFQYECFWLV